MEADGSPSETTRRPRGPDPLPLADPRLPLLSRDEECALARDVADRCIESLDKLVISNLALMVKIAKTSRLSRDLPSPWFS
jgi:DNA-directed RNA polymerase sigma subunit (sigma70/sigma32)